MSRHMHLFVNLNPGLGIHPARWKIGDPAAFYRLDRHLRIAEVAERGLLDALFVSDYPALTHDSEFQPWHVLEPTVILGAIAAHTSNIGLIATLSTTYNEPYNIARRIASIDHISGGRAAWNIVTSPLSIIAANFDARAGLPDHDQRYAQADEFVDVVRQLWDSWETDAFVADPATNRLVDRSKVWSIDHFGQRYAIKGPFQVPRSPQGQPVLIQAGSSNQGRDFAERHAEAIFVLHSLYDEAIKAYTDIKASVARRGRDPDALKILPGVWTLIGSTREEALRLRAELDEIRNWPYEIDLVAGRLGLEIGVDDLDTPVRELLDRPGPQGEYVTGLRIDAARFAQARGDLTLREFIVSSGSSIRQLLGSPQDIADDLEKWFRGGACDGFNLSFSHFPDQLEAFVDHVVPELQKRGIFRTAYEGSTFRDLLGLPKPVNRHAAARQARAPAAAPL